MAMHLQLGFELGELEAEFAEQCCFEAGALAVTLSNAREDRDEEAVLEPGPGRSGCGRRPVSKRYSMRLTAHPH